MTPPDTQPSQGNQQARLLELYDQLDRLEELIEDMAGLQIRSLDEAESRIVQLNVEIDELEQQDRPR